MLDLRPAGVSRSYSAALLVALAGCAATPGTEGEAPSASAHPTALRKIRPRLPQEPEPVVIVPGPSGRLVMFPSGEVVTQHELDTGRLEPRSPDGFDVATSEASGKLVLHVASGEAFPLKGEFALNEKWLYTWDAASPSGELRTLPSGKLFVKDGPAAAHNKRRPRIVGDFLLADSLLHLPDLVELRGPAGKAVADWGTSSDVAVALLGETGAGVYNVGGGTEDEYSLAVWDLDRGAQRGAASPPPKKVIKLGKDRLAPAVAVSPDGSFAIVSGAATGIRRVDLGAGKTSALLPAVAGEADHLVQIAADGKVACIRDRLQPENGFVVALQGAPADGVVNIPLLDESDCAYAAVPALPSGRTMPSSERAGFQVPAFAVIAKRSVNGALLAVLDRSAKGCAVRLLKGSEVVADLSYACGDHDELKFEGDELVVGDVKSERAGGGRISLTTLAWSQRFDAAPRSDAFETEQALLHAAGLDSVTWADEACSAAIQQLPSEGKGAPAARLELPLAASLPSAAHRGTRYWVGATARDCHTGHATQITFYDGWFIVNRVSDGKLLVLAVKAAEGVVALLAGGAVDVRGGVPNEMLRCQAADALNAWPSCRDRFLVPGGLESALAGREDFLEAP